MRNSWYVNSSFNLVQMYAGKYIYVYIAYYIKNTYLKK